MSKEDEPVAYLSNKRQRINIEIKPQTFVEIPTVTDWEMPLYMKPQQRTWVGLTDDEIDQGLVRSNYALQTAGAWRDGVEWATKQLKEKNNG